MAASSNREDTEPALAVVALAKAISLLGGAGAGMTAKLLTHPMDTIKARLQVQRQIGGAPGAAGPLYTGTLDAAVKVAKAEGLGGFYRGFGAVLIFQVPGATMYFGGYELGRAAMPDTALGHAGVGVMAQSVAGLVFTPQDVVKERMQVQAVLQQQEGKGYGYRGSAHALRTIIAKEGLVGPFRGYWLTNAAWVPWSILHVSAYERLRLAAAGVLGGPSASPEDLPAPAIAGCAMASSGSAALATSPIDVVKTKYQTLRHEPRDARGGGAPPRVAEIVRKVWAEEGVRGLWRGATARVLTIAPGTALTWLLYEEFKKAMM